MSRSRFWVLPLIMALAVPLLFGGLLHAVVPHTHSDNAVITSDMHSSFRHEEQAPLALPLLDTVLVFVLTALLVSFQVLMREGLLVRERHKIVSALRRGIVSYRRFG